MIRKAYFLDRDDSCHWYLVEADKRKEWERFIDELSRDEHDGPAPDFAKRLDGSPSSLVFHLVEGDG